MNLPQAINIQSHLITEYCNQLLKAKSEFEEAECPCRALSQLEAIADMSSNLSFIASSYRRYLINQLLDD